MQNATLCRIYITNAFFSSRRNSGFKTFVVKRFLARGGHEKEGVTAKSVNSSYYWTAVQETDFSVGVVIPVSFKNERLDSLQIPTGGLTVLSFMEPHNDMIAFIDFITQVL